MTNAINLSNKYWYRVDNVVVLINDQNLESVSWLHFDYGTVSGFLQAEDEHIRKRLLYNKTNANENNFVFDKSKDLFHNTFTVVSPDTVAATVGDSITLKLPGFKTHVCAFFDVVDVDGDKLELELDLKSFASMRASFITAELIDLNAISNGGLKHH